MNVQDILPQTAEHYFYAKKTADGIQINGEPRCFLGHKLHYDKTRKADGIYAEWLWDGNRLVVNNDRYGFYPLFYYCKDNEIYVSPSLVTLLSEDHLSKELDFAALSVFLRIGFFIGQGTPFKYIRIVPPNASFVWEDGRLDVSGEYACPNSECHLDYSKAIDQYQGLFQQSIRRRLTDEDYAVPLSGGRDSRHILFELMDQGRRPKQCVTLDNPPPDNDQDLKIASLITERLGLSHQKIDMPASRFKAELERIYATNFCSDELIRFMAMGRHLNGEVKAIYDGIGGDVLSAGLFLEENKLSLFRTGKLEELALLLLGAKEDWQFVSREVLPESFCRKVSLEIAVGHLIEELKNFERALNPVSAFYFWNRTRREVALSPFSILSDIPKVYAPYLDHDLYDFLVSLPAGLLLDHKFHTDTITRAYPQYADIPFENKKAKRIFSKEEYLYLNKSKEFLAYFIKNKLFSKTLVRKKYLLPRLLFWSVVRNRPLENLPRFLYLMELEAV